MEDSPDTRDNTHVLWSSGDLSPEIVDKGLGRDLQLTRKGDILYSETMRSVRRIEAGLPAKGGDGGPGTDPKFLRELAELLGEGKQCAGGECAEGLHDIADRLDYLNPSPPGTEDKAFKWLAEHVKKAFERTGTPVALNSSEALVIALYLLVVATKRSGTMSAIGGGISGVLASLFGGLDTDKPGFDTVKKGDD